MRELLEGLTPAQREAVCHVDGPLLILAGPGSGKTRVVTHRVANLLHQGIRPENLLALTFTNKAADEMSSRIERLAPAQRVWVSTFHRFCARLLRKYAAYAGLEENFAIYDADDSARTLRRVVAQLKLDDVHFTTDALASAISWAKNRLIGPEEYLGREGNPLGAVVQRVYPAYQAQLAQANAVDFDDLLMAVVRILRDNEPLRAELDERYRYILVDEYQDTNLAQYALVRALSIDAPNLAATGDPDQSIYGWRGANLANILEFERDFPSVRIVKLERNYRSTGRILSIASGLIAHNVRRKPKDLFTENAEGPPVRLVRYFSHRDEAQDIARQIAEQVRAGRRRPRDFAVFYRVNALSRSLESALREAGLRFQVVHGVEFFQRKEVKDIMAYLRLINNPRDDMAWLRAVAAPARGVGRTSLARLADHATRHGLCLLDAARDAANIEKLGAKAVKALDKFVALVDHLGTVAGEPIEAILGHVLAESGYRRQFEESSDPGDQESLANVDELLTVAREYDERANSHRRLEEFLEEVSLVGDTDDWDTEPDCVTLMTLHASKGLEFPVVFLVAVEQGILPHERSRDRPDQLEEERRLMFVGITRAKEELQISYTQQRDFRGQRGSSIASPFLMELPRGEMQVIEKAAPPGAAIEPFHDECGFADDLPVHRHESDLPEASSASAPAAGSTAAGATAAGSTAARAPAALPALLTAAQLQSRNGPASSVSSSSGSSAAPVSPEVFRHGMVVQHPELGLGRVIALSGTGVMRRATIQFVCPPQEATFILSKSPLRPAGMTP